ncbi:uncharacterized protein LOC124927239 [Impatiens glandulifera]|uniref:uncharacterized protein LOC124927239 n=1 Tax=Impatiens glandulifera TaxID=253017 RepID=UPI001FB0FE3D|nr:uncharacterized protein LOC124927239 [Impatiens glandulifera]
MMNKRAPPPSADLLVCFPSRAHLSLMPKPLNSPIRSSDSSNKKNHFPRRNNRHHHHNHNHNHRRRQESPILWAKTKSTSDVSEPTSPKVTCAGQIKVRPKSKNNWQSVIEEIERLHGGKRKQSIKNTFLNSSVFKKEAMHFMTCLRGIRLNFRCLGSFSTTAMTSDDDDEEDDVPETRHHWADHYESERWEDSSFGPPPPPNALLLMRSRSAPAISWPEEIGLEEKEEENSKKTNSLEAVMRHDIDFYMNSGDIVKETWMVGRPNPNPRDQRLLQRSRSWKR